MRTIEKRRAFTLVEMLVVIVIIGVLAGMILKLMAVVGRTQEKAACTAMLERVSNALNEYRAEYGQYPPVATNVCPRYLSNQGRPACAEDCRTCFGFLPRTNWMPGTLQDYFQSAPDDTGNGLKFGLVSFLISRSNPEKKSYTNLSSGISGFFQSNNTYKAHQDSSKDDIAKNRWGAQLEGLISGRDDGSPGSLGICVTNIMGQNVMKQGTPYGIAVYSLRDPWGWVIRYRSSPPYTSFELWSPGPDGEDGDNPNDPVDVREKKARDNVHKSGKWDE